MADLRVQHVTTQPSPVPADGKGGHQPRDQHQQPRKHAEKPGTEELAVALADAGHTAMEARYEEDAEGKALIRIMDTERGETIAVVTPEELRALTEQTGLPPGLLVRATR
jgi:hypothetical protein